MSGFTEEELAIAKSVDLTAVVAYLGYSVQRVGKYHTLKEIDSIRIYNRTHWFRWSRKYEKGKNGGSQIDFLKVFAGLEIKEAVFWLLDFAGYQKTQGEITLKYQVPPKQAEEKKLFVLPKAANGNQYLYHYLIKQRCISQTVVNYFLKKGLIYEAERYHNIVFKGNDKEGNTRFASMRGVFDDENGNGFQCDVAGNDKKFGFNDTHEESNEVIVFEAAIDLMSYMNIYNDFETNKIALGMLSDAPLETFLKEHPNIGYIKFCLDNDEQGRKATSLLLQKYKASGYQVSDDLLPNGYKDYNEWLKEVKHQSIDEQQKIKNI